MKAALDYLSPLALLAAIIAMGVHPSPVYLGGLAVSFASFMGERVLADRRAKHQANQAAVGYAAEVSALRVELKHVTDAVKQATSAQALNKARF